LCNYVYWREVKREAPLSDVLAKMGPTVRIWTI
jgi:hypothetical protein